MIHINKICVNLLQSDYLNHEYVHYILRNQGISKKMLLKKQISDQIKLVRNAVKNINEGDLEGQDIMFFKILKNDIDLYSSDPIYKFYDILPKFIIYYWGNEEYITYAIYSLFFLDENKNIDYYKFELENKDLKLIYENYIQIYSKLIDFKD